MHSIMKKFVLFAAFAALVLSSCTKENGTGFESNVRTVEFTASSVETKTVFGTPDNATYPTLWSDNDSKIGLTMNLAKILEADVTVSPDHKTASFAYEFEEALTNQFVVVNPYVALKSVNSSAGTFMMEVPSGQTSSATSPDERAQVMYGISSVTSNLPSKVNLTLKHAVEYLHISFNNVNLDGGTVQSVGISSEKNIAGRFFFTLDGAYQEGSSMLKSISVIPENLNDVWCAIAPVDLSNSLLTLSIVTDKGSLSKTLDIPSGREFKPGKIFKLSVNMDGITMQEPVEYQLVTSADALHWGDKVIIVAADHDFALSTAQNTNNRSGTGIAKGDGVILDPSEAVEIIQLGDGVIPGTWSLKATGGVKDGYLYAAAGINDAGNYLRTWDSLDEQTSWNISFGDFTDADKEAPDATRAIIHALTTKRSLLRYNLDSNLFSGYNDNTSTLPVKIYRLKGSPDSSPRFSASMPSDGKTISTSAAELPVYVFGNVSWTASVTGGASLDVTSGKGPATLTLTVPENTTTSAKEFKVTVSTSASVSPKSYTLTVTQNGVPASVDVKVGDVLYFENWAGAADGSTAGALDKYAMGGTKVLGNASVVYSASGAYTKTDANANCKLISGRDETLLITPKGSMTVSGIPCAGVKSATLSYVINRSQTGKYVPSSTTDGVTIGSENQDSETDGTSTAYILSFPVSFESGLSTFDLTITNNHSANTRFTNIQVVVTEVY